MRVCSARCVHPFVSMSGCGHACFHVPMPVVTCAYICGHAWAHTHVSDVHSGGHAWLCAHVCGHACILVQIIALAGVSELCHAELGALDFEEGPWFCRLLCPSLESVFNYPPHCAKSGVSARCHSLLLSRPPGRPLLSRRSAWLCSKSRVIGTGPLKSPGGLCHEHSFKCLPCLRSGRRRCLLWPCSWLHSLRGHFPSGVFGVQLNWFGVQRAPADSGMG